MLTDLRRPDQILAGRLILLTLFLIIAGWFVGVFLMYDIKGMVAEGLYYAALSTLDTPLLWVGPILGLIIGVVTQSFLYRRYSTGFGGAKYQSRLRGNKLVSKDVLKSITNENRKQLVFAGIPVPKKLETLMFLVIGSTGVGKSVCIGQYIDSALKRNDRVIVIDPDAGFMSRYYQDGDVILNPFDVRTEGWTIFNELDSPIDCNQYAVSMIPKSPSTEQETWNSMARTIITELLLKLKKENRGTTEELIHWATEVNMNELREFLKGTPAQSCFDAEQTMASIRTVLTHYVVPHKYLPKGEFSFKKWMKSGKGNIFITWREDQMQALKPLISCWTDVIFASGLSLDEDPDRKITHVVIDELDSLEKLNYIVDGVTKGRKKGLISVSGIQSLSQLDNTYGVKEALTLRNSYRNFACFGISDLDTYSPEEVSKGFGNHTVVRKETDSNTGKTGSKRTTRRSVTERLIDPSEIHGLPDLTGYVKLAGDKPIAKVALIRKDVPVVAEKMIFNEKVLRIGNEVNVTFFASETDEVD